MQQKLGDGHQSHRNGVCTKESDRIHFLLILGGKFPKLIDFFSSAFFFL